MSCFLITETWLKYCVHDPYGVWLPLRKNQVHKMGFKRWNQKIIQKIRKFSDF